MTEPASLLSQMTPLPTEIALPGAAEIDPAAARLLQESICWDMCGVWQEIIPARSIQVLDRYRKAGFSFVSLTVADDQSRIGDTVAYLGSQIRWVEAHADTLMLCASVDDVEQAKASGKLGIAWHFQGTNAFDGKLDMVQAYYELGVRHALLAYNQKNMVGDGCHERTDAGLSRFGLALIREMNRVGMLVDCTHCGVRTTLDAMEASGSPVIFSHSLCRNLHDHERNIWDEQIRALGRNGGVIGVNGVNFFLNGDGDFSAEALFRHIDHIAQQIGARHVGLGLDYVYFHNAMVAHAQAFPDKYPTGYSAPHNWRYAPPEILPRLVEVLLAHGYRADDVRGILGGNFARLARQVWTQRPRGAGNPA